MRRHTLFATCLLCDFLFAVDPLIVQISFRVRAQVPLFVMRPGYRAGREDVRSSVVVYLSATKNLGSKWSKSKAYDLYSWLETSPQKSVCVDVCACVCVSSCHPHCETAIILRMESQPQREPAFVLRTTDSTCLKGRRLNFLQKWHSWRRALPFRLPIIICVWWPGLQASRLPRFLYEDSCNTPDWWTLLTLSPEMTFEFKKL